MKKKETTKREKHIEKSTSKNINLFLCISYVILIYIVIFLKISFIN